MVKVLALDIEVTTYNKGDPFDQRNSFVLGGWYDGNSYATFDSTSFTNNLSNLWNTKLRLVMFNAKFDLHWLRNQGVQITPNIQIWDCQLAEYILSNQKWKYPSLDEACANRKLPRKLDVVKTEFWDKGINTNEIPINILTEYLQGDLTSTYALYLAQVEEFKKPEHQGKYKLFRLHCQDLLVLEEMEYNGYKYDTTNSRVYATTLAEKVSQIDRAILSEFDGVPINLGSPDHISCILFGGNITEIEKIPIGFYKTGMKVGHIRYKNVEKTYQLPRLIQPLKGSELAKEGYFSTNEDTLRNLRATGKPQRIIEGLLERRGLEKLKSTYLEGIPTIIEEHHWPNSIVHGQLNQCVTITGRLSATKPNQQNKPPEVKQFCISRYI